MSRRRNKSRNKSGPKFSSILSIAILVPLVAAAGFFLMQRNAEIEATDRTTMCRSDLAPMLTAVIIDTSDNPDAVQREQAIARLMELARRSSEGARFEVYRMGTLGDELARPVFSICNPGQAGSALITNAEGDRVRFDEQFLGALEEEILRASEGEADNSPIIENIRSVSASAFARLGPETRRSLVVISDMIQHSEMLSQYGAYPSYEAFRDSGRGVSSFASLDRVDVEIIYLLRARDRAIQGRGHLAWWEEYFRANGGYLAGVQSY